MACLDSGQPAGRLPGRRQELPPRPDLVTYPALQVQGLGPVTVGYGEVYYVSYTDWPSNLAPVEECLSVVAMTAASVEVLPACVLDEVIVMGTTHRGSSARRRDPSNSWSGSTARYTRWYTFPRCRFDILSRLLLAEKKSTNERACYNVYRVGEIIRGCFRCWCWPPEETGDEQPAGHRQHQIGPG